MGKGTTKEARGKPKGEKTGKKRPKGTLCGEGLTIGRDSADPVSSLYGYGFDFTGGEIAKVVFDIADDAYLDLEAHLAAAMARD
ncbi:hypothetical protein JM654_13115 [Microbacterium oxydans]|nr:hypothetical protein [Microbacterium oxydans]